MSLCHDHILVSGRVQGVGYRYFAFEAARRAGVFGNVRNLHVGTCDIEGNHPPVDAPPEAATANILLDCRDSVAGIGA